MCGIVGFISKSRNFNPNIPKLKILAIDNDSRGGNGVGLWFNNYEDLYKTDKVDDFTEFFIKDLKLFNSTSATSCILHTRKASKGSKTINNLHPYKLSDKFIFCHNGTIHNIDELLTEYPLDDTIVDLNNIEHYTDSFILANIIKEYGYEVLNEYHGTAALLWTDDGGKTLKVFKGKSKNTNYSTSSESTERPLYFLKTKEGIYFSSRDQGLKIIQCISDRDIVEIPTNVIMEFNGKTLGKKLIEIDRSSKCQSKFYESTTTARGFNTNRHWYGQGAAVGYSPQLELEYDSTTNVITRHSSVQRATNNNFKAIPIYYKYFDKI